MTSRAMIIVGGGSSTRFGIDKLAVVVAGRPLVAHTIAAVRPHVDRCVVVCRPALTTLVEGIGVATAPGGATRTLSEMSGLASIGADVDLVGIHDAARPMVDGPTIDLLFETADRMGGAIPILSTDQIILDRRSHRTLERVGRSQTPQVFRTADIMAAYVRAAQSGFEGRDTAEIMQRFSDVRIAALPGDPGNIKVTFPEDLDEVRSRLEGPSHTGLR